MENRSNDQIVTEKRSADGDGKVYSQEVIRESRFWMPFGKISWPAIFAGVLVTTVAQMLLSLLGIGIGLSTVDVLREQNPASGLGIGSIIWWSVSMLVSLFLGGWTTGRLYSARTRGELILNGLLTWCTFTIFSFFMLTSGIGMLVSGAGNIIGSALSAGATAAQSSQIDLSDVTREARNLFLQSATAGTSASPAGTQENASSQESAGQRTGTQPSGRAGTNAQQSTEGRAQQNPSINSQLFLNDLENFFRAGDMNNTQARQSLVNTLVNQTGMTEREANQKVDQWISSYQDLKEKAKVKADQAARAVSIGSIVGFFALVIGALVTIWGASMAPPSVAEYPTTKATM